MKRTKRQKAYIGSLKPWLTTSLDANKLGIECPHKECGGKAVVNKKKWLNLKREYVGRSCTYCFRTSRVPDGLH